MNKYELRRDQKQLIYDVNDQIMVWVEQGVQGLFTERTQWVVRAQLTTQDPGLATTMATSEAFGLFQALDLAWLVALTVRNTLDHAEFEEVCKEVHNMLPWTALHRDKFSRFPQVLTRGEPIDKFLEKKP